MSLAAEIGADQLDRDDAVDEHVPGAVHDAHTALPDARFEAITPSDDFAEGRVVGGTSDVTIDRTEVGGGWFLTSNLEAKAEYVQQNYRDYPLIDIHHDGKFHGAMFEAVVSF